MFGKILVEGDLIWKKIKKETKKSKFKFFDINFCHFSIEFFKIFVLSIRRNLKIFMFKNLIEFFENFYYKLSKISTHPYLRS